jgi:undecaprenyl-diphosphatase
MEFFKQLLLGVIQGLTEFLPVSSSGHLVLFGNWLGQSQAGNLTEVLLHTGTFLATILVFRKEIITLLLGILKKESEQLQKAGFIILASIPTAFFGLMFKDFLEGLFENPTAVSGMLIVTGIILLLTKFFGTGSTANTPNGDGEFSSGATQPLALTPVKALIIGVAQSFAIIPGVSRSGSTICAALFLKVNRTQAGEFSFLISLPAIAGATLLHVKDLIGEPLPSTIGMPMLLGVLASFFTGLFALKWLLGFVKNGKMYLFAPYVFALGIFGLFYF